MNVKKIVVKKIVNNTIFLIIKESLYGIVLSIISMIRKSLDTVIMQMGSNAEIDRFKGETPLFIVELLQNNNNAFHLISNGLNLIVIVLMIYAGYNYINNTYLSR